MDVIKTETGDISGMVMGEPGKEVHVFRGIPYAAPPIGDLRWKPPQPVVPWSGVRECISYSQIAPQASIIARGLPQNEDCLYLNILTPVERETDKLAVMVWLHGGGYDQGNGNSNLCNGLNLPGEGVVLVNVNTRLGPLGCIAHPLISREAENGVSGNYLFLDIIAALQWIKKNIHGFGGDPENITIFGESGGSAKVINLIASPLSKGLFQRAIGESGGCRGITLEEAENRGERVFVELGVDKEINPLAAARVISPEDIISATQKVTEELKLPMGLWDSVVDGRFLPEKPIDIFTNGKSNVVQCVMGANLGEITGPGMILMPDVTQTYVNVLKGINKVGAESYAYIFDHVPAGWRKNGVPSCHGMELPYVFGDTDYRGEFWSLLFWGNKEYGAESEDPGFTNADTQVKNLMMDMWTGFAKTGNPNLKGRVEWSTWDEKSDQYLYITESPEVRSGFSKVAQK